MLSRIFAFLCALGSFLCTFLFAAGCAAGFLMAAGVPTLNGTIPLVTSCTFPSGTSGQFNSTAPVTVTYGTALGSPTGTNPWVVGNGTDSPSPCGRNGSALTMDIFTPSGTPPAGGFSVIMQFHGGVQQSFSANDCAAIETSIGGVAGEAPQWSFGLGLTGHGYVVAVVWYPLNPGASTSVNPYPGFAQAAFCALRYIKANASTLHVNGEKIGTWGESAGNWVASLLATNGSPTVGPVPDAPVGTMPTVLGTQQHFDNPGCNTPTSATNTDVQVVSNQYGFWNGVGQCGAYISYWGALCPGTPAINETGSPYYQVTSGDAPEVIMRGQNDTASTDFFNKQWLLANLSLSIPAVYFPIPNTNHGYHLGVDNHNRTALCTVFSEFNTVLSP
jgi:acetyl esterase/lipase